MNTITREKFMAYEQIRKDGFTNMTNIDRVVKLTKQFCLTKLTRKECLEISDNYSKYKNQYLKD